ncbi:cysteine proteinase [Patellaria atrata CBS 101060]|uniref:Ubiquitin carboxyl-terminal hydrolase n=1 Tax=Patellaria atrata CBS 101060 TaxID=1346257 RepID=A0A9P4S482_9PEZI|nr:cysteine proteinase [Patellaria atrata CBS 101060]
MVRPTKRLRRRLNRATDQDDGEVDQTKHFPNPPTAPATDEDRRKWGGYCEIENDPSYFNVMLSEFGVEGVKVQEVFGLDEGSLSFLPKPVYGLIFLFKYRELNDPDEQDDECPKHVWFANQIGVNSCASVALINIACNIPGVDLGPAIQSYKEFTQEMDPFMRGYQLANFEFVKHIHNSFARKSDMLAADHAMLQDFKEWKSKSKKRKAKTKEVEEHAFHFNAYMPIQGEIWKLDGLDHQPHNLGPSKEDNWMDIIAPILTAKMLELGEEEVQYSLMALVKDPIIDRRAELSANVKAIRTIERRLTTVDSNWRNFVDSAESGSILRGPDDAMGIFFETIHSAVLPDGLFEKIQKDDDVMTLLDKRAKIITEQAGLKKAVQVEKDSWAEDKRKAALRRIDWIPFIRKWLGFLNDNGVLEGLIEKHTPK